ncbi:MAG: M48 family metalloprotease [Rickettsiales bacterium]
MDKNEVDLINKILEKAEIDLPHTKKFFETIMNGFKENQKDTTKVGEISGIWTKFTDKVKGDVSDLTGMFVGKYDGLTSSQKIHAFKNFSSSAHIAIEETDREILSLFKDAFNSSEYKYIKKIPNLVICTSDLPFAHTYKKGEDEAVFISSNLISILKDDMNKKSKSSFEERIKAVLRHELSHINDYNERGWIVSSMSYVIPKFRKNGEYRADEHGSLNGKESDAMIDALSEIFVRKEELSKAVVNTAKKIIGNVKKDAGANKVTDYLFSKAMNRLSQYIKNGSITERIMEDGSTHPSIANRIAKIGEQGWNLRN